MKKTLLCMCVVLIAVMVFGLAGCTREAYTQEEMDQITHKGMEMMRAWLDENMPEAEIENCEALSLWSYDHAMYLTDYVRGNILHKGEKMAFTIHTVTGQVYFNHQQQEGSEYLRHDYLLLSADWDPESEKTGILMSWAKQADGTYKLVHGESGQSKPLSNGRLEQFE